MINQYVLLNLLIPLVIKFFIPDGRFGSLTIVVDFIILPIGLLIMNILLVNNKVCSSFTMSCLFMLVGLLLGNLMGYFMWGYVQIIY